MAPAELFDDLVSLARLTPGARVLELGCGTGQATVPLAERGLEVVALELGEKLADAARRTLAAFPHVRGVTTSFEEWEPREFEASGFFRNVTLRRYRWDARFDAAGYVERLGTSSWHLALPADVRERLLECIRQRIAAAPGGSVTVTTLAALYVAERS